MRTVEYFALMELKSRLLQKCYNNAHARDVVALIDRKLAFSSMS